MPSQKQLKWSQLKVGITVLVASITLGVLIFLMSGTGGWLTPKIVVKSYFDNASGLRVGAPVRLDGVDVGNVTRIRVVSAADKKQTPVEVTMKVSTTYKENLRKDSVTSLSTAGVLGETYIDIDSSQASGPAAGNGDVLPIRDHPDISDVVRASQGTLQNLDALLKRMDRIIAFVESGQGSVGKLIYDPTLYDRLASTVREFQDLVNQVSQGNGTIGKLISDDELYRKANATVDKLNGIIDDLEAGEGTAGKLLRDPSLFNNADQMLVEGRELVKAVRENPKKYLTIHLKIF